MKPNDECAKKAESALFSAYSDDPANAVVDLLADLMHYADREGMSFDLCVQIARNHYKAEKQTEGESK